jgi:vacuolar-type H+-ATPase subunit H
MKERKIALAVGNFIDEADQEILEAVRKAAQVLKEQGASIKEVNMDFLRKLHLPTR